MEEGAAVRWPDDRLDGEMVGEMVGGIYLEKDWERAGTWVEGQMKLSLTRLNHLNQEPLADRKHICPGKTSSDLFR